MNGVKRRGAVGEIASRKALSVLPKAPSPLEVTCSDLVVWKFGDETWRMRSCVTCMPSLTEKVVLL